MAIEYEYKLLIAFILIVIIVLTASIAIPVYGYNRKRFKGLSLGCLLQPIISAIVIIVILLGIIGYKEWQTSKQKKETMVTIRSLESHADGVVDTLMWYIKDDGECIFEKKRDKDIEDSVKNKKDEMTKQLYDVIRLNAASVGVEDRVMVKFDIKSKKVMATDLFAPAEVVSVDWEKVNAYFERKE
jgi:uncharacterized membrane protein